MKNMLKKKPFIRDSVRIAKNIKRAINRLMSRNQPKLLGKEVKIPNYKNVFFGYYDKTPFNETNENLIIVHANNANSTKKPNPDIATDILLFDWSKGKVIKKLGETFSWNWQQGARAHWLSEEKFIYNIFDKSTNSYKAVIGNIHSNKKRLLPIPVQESHPSGLIFSISYETLNEIRPDYGYRNHLHKGNIDCNLSLYDLRSEKQELIISKEELLEHISSKVHTETISNMKINHVLVSPTAKNVIFLVRYFSNGKRITDLFSFNLITKISHLLLHDCGASHYAWLNEGVVILTCNGEKGFGYYKLDIDTNLLEFVISIGDGHPSTLNDNYAITDVYPDKYGIRHLYLLNIREKSIAKEYSSYIEPYQFHGETRCDLHPSISPSKRYIQIDTGKGKNRSIRIIESNWSELIDEN